jgi:hypothetical protein
MWALSFEFLHGISPIQKYKLKLTPAAPGDGDGALPGDVEHPVQVDVVEGAEVVADTGRVGDAPHGATAMRRRLHHGPTVILDVLVAGAPQRYKVVVAGCSRRSSCSRCAGYMGGGKEQEEERCGQDAASRAHQLVHLD